MAVRAGNQKCFTRVASGNQLAGRVATISGNFALQPTSGQIAFPIAYRADNAQHVSLVEEGHAKVFYGSSLGVGASWMAGGSGFITLAASGQIVGGFTLTAADSGVMGEVTVERSNRSTT